MDTITTLSERDSTDELQKHLSSLTSDKVTTITLITLIDYKENSEYSFLWNTPL